jgi:hypothetical protein
LWLNRTVESSGLRLAGMHSKSGRSLSSVYTSLFPSMSRCGQVTEVTHQCVFVVFLKNTSVYRGSACKKHSNDD